MNDNGITIVIAFLMSDTLNLIRIESLLFRFVCVRTGILLEFGHEREIMRANTTHIRLFRDSLKMCRTNSSSCMEFLMSKYDMMTCTLYNLKGLPFMIWATMHRIKFFGWQNCLNGDLSTFATFSSIHSQKSKRYE